MSDEKKELNESLKDDGISTETNSVKKEEQKQVLPAWRTIEISTDGNSIKVIRAEVAGRLELLSILKELIKVYEK
jgi:hypothetical protein